LAFHFIDIVSSVIWVVGNGAVTIEVEEPESGGKAAIALEDNGVVVHDFDAAC
jgi:hypothetical protein